MFTISDVLRLRLYGRRAGAAPEAGVPLQVSWERAYEGLSQLPRMFIEPDGSFLWTGQTASESAWQLEGTMFDDGVVLRRIELIGNCPQHAWQQFLDAISCDWNNISVESLADNCVLDGQWLLTVSLSFNQSAEAPARLKDSE